MFTLIKKTIIIYNPNTIGPITGSVRNSANVNFPTEKEYN